MSIKMKTRFRAQPRSFGRQPLLVLQVEESIEVTYNEIDLGAKRDIITVWRDAREFRT